MPFCHITGWGGQINSVDFDGSCWWFSGWHQKNGFQRFHYMGVKKINGTFWVSIQWFAELCCSRKIIHESFKLCMEWLIMKNNFRCVYRTVRIARRFEHVKYHEALSSPHFFFVVHCITGRRVHRGKQMSHSSAPRHVVIVSIHCNPGCKFNT